LYHCKKIYINFGGDLEVVLVKKKEVKNYELMTDRLDNKAGV